MILALYGAGAMGREFKYMADESGKWPEIVFIDDRAETELLLGCPVYRFQQFRARFSPADVRFVVAIGEPKFRREAFERMNRAGYTGGVIVHPSAYISPDATVGEGTAICHGAFIGSQARIGKNCYLSRNASVGHDAAVGDHTRLGVNAFIGGHAVIGENAFIGAGALLRDRVRFGSASVAALGAAVFDDVPDGVTVIGNPARIAGDGAGNAVFAPSKKLEESKDQAEEKSVPEQYWEVFSGCFEGIEFNPVTFKYHDAGWDSVAHMALISKLEEAFRVSFKGREAMKLKSYGEGLNLIKTKLEQTNGGQKP
ncbi:MAG: NeuD/PglB/VioB family sugar acetyltransferase [Clostridia bacterium]|nr:NeuD/PglB/VioB family sugar acetyltransferase [Clostridia bacterium]